MTEVFPEGFVWGVATSAFQVEGAHDADGRGPSIWDRFAAEPGRIEDGTHAQVACDHYHRFADDVALMKTLGVQAYRFSVAWPRVLPVGRGLINDAGLDFYDRLVDALLEAGITPWATLYHWDLPQALEDGGGWPERATAEAFVEYADVVSARLGDRVNRWMTHNEPWCASVLGYALGQHAPGKTDWARALAAAHHILLSHGLAIPVIRRNSLGAKVGLAHLTTHCEPASPSEEDQAAARQFDGEFNRWFLDAAYHGHYPADVIAHHERVGRLPRGLDFVRPGDLDIIRTPTDFLGVNYYTRTVVRSTNLDEAANAPRTVPVPDRRALTDMGWEIYPEGLVRCLARIQNDYDPGPMFMTENGCAFATGPGSDERVVDVRRCHYLADHLRACLSALDKGISLKGYFAWSLFDNFEWAFGLAKRFGIVWVDFDTQERIIKESGRMYSRIIRGNRLSEEQAA